MMQMEDIWKEIRALREESGEILSHPFIVERYRHLYYKQSLFSMNAIYLVKGINDNAGIFLQYFDHLFN